jgi:methylated-DNA-[protein]-cysteine S-methyltransferase
MAKRYHKILKSPVGTLTLVAEDEALIAVCWESKHAARLGLSDTQRLDRHPVLLTAEKQLLEYFSGHRRKFDLPFEFNGTDFQIEVWSALCKIPFGETRTYGDLARTIGAPKACRAVGASNGRNPIAIIVPCHRVIGANGKLIGFAGGLEIKDHLLKMERR